MTCSCTQHRCVTCRTIDIAQDLNAPVPVGVYYTRTRSDAWGASTGIYKVTPLDNPPEPAPHIEAWGLAAVVAVDGAVTWSKGWGP